MFSVIVKKFKVKLPLLSNWIVRLWAPEAKACDVNMVPEVGNEEFVPLRVFIMEGTSEST